MTRARLALTAAVAGTAAVLAAGYAADGLTGLVDAAALAAIGVLIVARGTVRGGKPRPANLRPNQKRAPAVSAADFPAYRKIASDLEWAQLSRRHYEHAVRPMLARLAAALGRPDAVPAGPAGPAADIGGPGVDLATLDRIVTRLEPSEQPEGTKRP